MNMTGFKLLLFCVGFVLASNTFANGASQAPSPLDSLTAQKIVSTLLKQNTLEDRNETEYELRITDKMRKMDLWVENLSAGEKTRIEEDLDLKLRWVQGNISIEEKRRLIKHKIEKAEKHRMDEWDLWGDQAKNYKRAGRGGDDVDDDSSQRRRGASKSDDKSDDRFADKASESEDRSADKASKSDAKSRDKSAEKASKSEDRSADKASKSEDKTADEASKSDDNLPDHPTLRVATLRDASEAPTKRLYHTPGEGFDKPYHPHASHDKPSDAPAGDHDLPSRTAATSFDAPSGNYEDTTRADPASENYGDSPRAEEASASKSYDDFPRADAEAASSEASEREFEAPSRLDTSANGDEVRVESVRSGKNAPLNRHMGLGDQFPGAVFPRPSMTRDADAPGPMGWPAAAGPLSVREELFLSSKEAMQRSWAQRLGKKPLDLTQYVG